jgi:hypothetical protein
MFGFQGSLASCFSPLSWSPRAPPGRRRPAKVYSYQLPWSGSTLVRSTIVPLPSEKAYDGTARLAAYLTARSRVQALYLAAVRALPLVGKSTVGDLLDKKPAVRKRVETFLTHARIRSVAYRPARGSTSRRSPISDRTSSRSWASRSTSFPTRRKQREAPTPPRAARVDPEGACP